MNSHATFDKFLLIILFLFLALIGYKHYNSPLNECVRRFQFLSTDEELKQELEKQGTTFDKRLREACEYWIKTGQWSRR